MQAKVSKPQFAHLWSLVLGLIVNLRASRIVHLSAVTPDSGHRTRRGAFLNHSQWDSAALVHQAAFKGIRADKAAHQVVKEVVHDSGS